ncbi:MAG: hypothetical protein BMS9Abin09_0570 [Gammaproteobacteria bacterium]|nr:MAG: hypothetical protein BMS9Abin09_0570 [Gammaproteobacteria bacterium]
MNRSQEIHRGKSLVRRLKRKFALALLLARKKVYRLGIAVVRRSGAASRVVYVAGVQRSGTNMLMYILDQPLVTEVFHERNPDLYDGYQMRSREVLRSVIGGCSAQFIVVKTLCELQYVREFLDEFPGCRCIWLFRNHADVVNSHIAHGWYKMPYFIGEIVAGRLDNSGWRGSDLPPAILDTIRDLYHPDIDNVSACALFWYYRNMLYFALDLDHEERVLVVSYEQLVADKAQQFQHIFDFVGIDYDPKYVANVHGRSLSKKSPPVIEPRIRDACMELERRLLKNANR